MTKYFPQFVAHTYEGYLRQIEILTDKLKEDDLELNIQHLHIDEVGIYITNVLSKTISQVENEKIARTIKIRTKKGLEPQLTAAKRYLRQCYIQHIMTSQREIEIRI